MTRRGIYKKKSFALSETSDRTFSQRLNELFLNSGQETPNSFSGTWQCLRWMRGLIANIFTRVCRCFTGFCRRNSSRPIPREHFVYPRLELPQHYDLDFEYKMNHDSRGIALIFNHETYFNQRCSRRHGTSLDRDRLSNVLESFNFEVKIFNDLSVDGIIHELQRGESTKLS